MTTITAQPKPDITTTPCPPWCTVEHGGPDHPFHRSAMDSRASLDAGLWLLRGCEDAEPVIVFGGTTNTMSLSEAITLRDKLDRLVWAYENGKPVPTS